MSIIKHKFKYNSRLCHRLVRGRETDRMDFCIKLLKFIRHDLKIDIMFVVKQISQYEFRTVQI